MLQPIELGPAPEPEIARDLVRRVLPFAPVVVAAAAVPWGWPGASSAAYALVLVLANFVLAAAIVSWAARISLAALMGAALGGYVVRLALVGFAVWIVKDGGWVEPVALGLTLVIAHLGSLVWELRFVSMSLAHPGLKPAVTPKEPTP